MSETQVSENVSRFGLTLALVLVFLAWSMAGVSAPAVDHQFDGPGSCQVVALDSSGDSPSADLGPPGTALSVFPLASGHLVFSPNLFFVEPPARFLSYPSLPQGPPHLV
jgi:hypothetical protein